MARTADGLIDAYLMFARAGQPPSPDATADVARVIADVVEDLAPVALAKDARLEVSTEEVAVLCSESFLHTMLMNLIANGLKYLDGGARREVSVSVRAVGVRCEISVTDGGAGIPPSALDNIFKPFYRVPGVKAPGTGIGLATVSRIVKAHDGRLWVDSMPGQGSTFIVDLPRAGAAEAAARAPARHPVPARGGGDLVVRQAP
jgi:signal transduction histidine kinase